MITATDSIINERMLELIDILLERDAISTRQEFLDIIGMRKQNFRAITQGTSKFTLAMVEIACTEFNVNANWLIGVEKKIFR